MYETLIRMYYFFDIRLGSLPFSAYCPFHMVEGLDVAMWGAGGRGGEGRGRVSLCCNMLLWW